MILVHLNLNPVISVQEDDFCLTNRAFCCFRAKTRPSLGFNQTSVRRGCNFGTRCPAGRRRRLPESGYRSDQET